MVPSSYKTIIFLTFLFLVAGTEKSKGSREKKLFSLFNIVTFANEQCTAKSDTSIYGICYTNTECESRSGTKDGNCAAGFGVCCTFSLSSCGSTVNQNCTYIQNPSFPNTYSTSGACSYTINYIQSDICQLRLDFNMFDITDVATTGVCTDSFTVTGPTGRNPSVICGVNTGQHMYVETGSSTTATAIGFTIASTGGGSWRIKVSQIECTSNARAPTDCVQYFTGISGEVKSFNFDGGIQLRDIQYTICIRRETGSCGIQYTVQDNTTPDSYDLSDATANANGGSSATGEAMGYIAVPGSNTDLYSGTILSSQTGTAEGVDGVLLATGMTFIIGVTNTDADQTSSNGFDFVYAQTPCSLSI